jgi:hypothetical protein
MSEGLANTAAILLAVDFVSLVKLVYDFFGILTWTIDVLLKVIYLQDETSHANILSHSEMFMYGEFHVTRKN